MSFIRPQRPGNASSGYYWLTILIVFAAYFIGSLPFSFAYVFTGQHGDPMLEMGNKYGLNTTFALVILPIVLCFFAILMATKWLHRFPLTTIFTGRRKFDFKRLFVALGLWGVAMLINLLIDWNDGITWNFDAGKFAVLFVLAIVLLPLQCMAEELFFRGILLQWFGKSISNRWVVAVITGTLFGLVHGANPEITAIGFHAILYYIFSGIFLSAIVVIDDGLELTIGYHIANNLFIALLLTSRWQSFQTDALFRDTNPPSFTVVNILVLMGLQALFMFCCARIFKWKDKPENETNLIG